MSLFSFLIKICFDNEFRDEHSVGKLGLAQTDNSPNGQKCLGGCKFVIGKWQEQYL